jgi:hypothetical protein
VTYLLLFLILCALLVCIPRTVWKALGELLAGLAYIAIWLGVVGGVVYWASTFSEAQLVYAGAWVIGGGYAFAAVMWVYIGLIYPHTQAGRVRKAAEESYKTERAFKALEEAEGTKLYRQKVAEREADDAELATLSANPHRTMEDRARMRAIEEKYGNAPWQLRAAGFNPYGPQSELRH